MIDEPVRLNPEIGWDKDVLSYFDHRMTDLEYDNEVRNGNSVKVTIELNIRYEQAQPVVVDEEDREPELLQDLHERVSVLEQQVLAVLARYL